ncbi:MAG: TRAP transporter small permease [Thermanaeromonas sp.]|nr:TRAP transporter small permease [Thermanaeromonas sp.]
MAIIVTLQVVWRYFLKSPIFWAEELARYSLVWMTFVGAAVALRAGQLASIEILVEKLSPPVRRWMRVLVLFLNVVLLIFLFYYSVVLVGLPSVVNQRSPAMRVPMVLPYLALPVGLGLTLLQGIFQLLIAILEKESRE